MFNYFYKLYFSLFCGVKFGKKVVIRFPCNLYDCTIGDYSFVGRFVECQDGVVIGNNSCIQSHSFLAGRTYVGHNTFIGHGFFSANDRNPIAFSNEWVCEPPVIGHNCSIGSSVNILPGIKIGNGAKIGMGATVCKDIPNGETWIGPAAQKIKDKQKTIGFNK